MDASLSTRFAAFVLLALLPTCLSAEELRWKFGPGEQWSVTLHAETSSTSTLNTKTLRTKLETRVETLWTIDEVADKDSATITQEIVRLTLTGTGADGVGIQYDSAAEEKPVGPAKDIAKAVAPFVGAKIRCRMNARGEISDVVPADELKAALGGEKEGSADRWGLELLQQPLCLLLAKEVAAGGQWEQERKLSLPLGSFVQKQTFRLPNEEEPKKESNRVRISTQAVLTPEKTETPTKSGLKEQEQTGEIIFDSAAGRLVRSQTTQKLTLATPFRDKEVVVKTQSIRRVELTQIKEAATGG